MESSDNSLYDHETYLKPGLNSIAGESLYFSDISLENAKVASDFLKVLGNENRLIILCALSKHELKVGEMEQLLGIRQPTLSQQLARLRAKNLVHTRRVAKEVFYSLASREAQKTIEFLFDLIGNQDLDFGNRRAAGS